MKFASRSFSLISMVVNFSSAYENYKQEKCQFI